MLNCINSKIYLYSCSLLKNMDDYIIRMKRILKIAFKVRLIMYSRNIKTLLLIVYA